MQISSAVRCQNCAMSHKLIHSTKNSNFNLRKSEVWSCKTIKVLSSDAATKIPILRILRNTLFIEQPQKPRSPNPQSRSFPDILLGTAERSDIAVPSTQKISPSSDSPSLEMDSPSIPSDSPPLVTRRIRLSSTPAVKNILVDELAYIEKFGYYSRSYAKLWDEPIRDALFARDGSVTARYKSLIRDGIPDKIRSMYLSYSIKYEIFV